MPSPTICTGGFLLSLSGVIFCSHWIKTAEDKKDMSMGIFCLTGSSFTLITCILLFIYSNGFSESDWELDTVLYTIMACSILSLFTGF